MATVAQGTIDELIVATNAFKLAAEASRADVADLKNQLVQLSSSMAALSLRVHGLPAWLPAGVGRGEPRTAPAGLDSGSSESLSVGAGRASRPANRASLASARSPRPDQGSGDPLQGP